MALTGYESVVGWRYLLRPKANPRVLLIGLAIVALGGAAVAIGYFAQPETPYGTRSLLWIEDPLWRGVVMSGAGIAALGVCIAVFGILHTFLTTFSAFSAFMVTIGVAEVILVLGVMNGFQKDLRQKIIDTHAHVVIEPPGSGPGLPDYRDVAVRARAVEGVIGVSPYLSTDVMLSSRTNLAPVMFMGIDIETVGESSKLPQMLEHGSLDVLVRPDAVEPVDVRGPHMSSEIKTFEHLINAQNASIEMKRAAESPDAEPSVAAAAGNPLSAFDMSFPVPTKHNVVPTLLLGAELRRNLNIWPGELVNVISPYGDLSPGGLTPKSRPFRVAGWFESGMLEFDTKLAYASLESVQHYMGVGDEISGIQVRVADLEAARGVRNRLREALGGTAHITDWQERNRNLFSALKLEKVAMFLVLTINILLAAFSITGTLVVTILERKREIAILRTMGATNGGILRIFLSQGAFAGLVGSAFGSLIGLGGGVALARMGLPMNPDVYYISAIPVDVRAPDVVAIIFVALLVSVASTLYPALYAARLRPIEGLVGD